ncbi:CsgG/HfaB family protein [Methylicorpusculum sp.]|uniref:CsgG/HfaB family protein n=1 Tax=Methylicorpusculum sp. TaxID=2713644 RepID=UPI00271FCF52|nr:CsgG/HfaB family protein [Methylicorpusculum sp.]MDO8845745.1 CsgG/HfaB family protein [Methylicorpusculum sp.]MDP2177748.1 CsgG/HfaB family protein [Methylicorpusculum sp.]MDP3527877.1 CsgG/HfaB family protein [Methylicorpusculum sp.]MDZ4154650.1 CsgG/HfaB family protein [Methylicorpusculum sp.]
MPELFNIRTNYLCNFWRIASILSVLFISGCATETHRALVPESVPSSTTVYQGIKHSLVVGKFDNRSAYMRGIFSDGIDQLGSQAKTILKTHLQQSGRFDVVDRENMEEIAQEAKIRGAQQQLQGAQVVLTGNVTEFGRRTTGDTQLFGILGYGKNQVAYAKVALNVVDVKTSRIIYSVQGAGEYELSNREVIGFGSSAGYDATLNGKVLNLAIMEAVNNLVNGLERGQWNPTPGN